MSRVQLALNVANIDDAIEFYSKLFATPTEQGPARLRQLRDRRAAAEARAHRRSRRAGHAQPPRCRGAEHRRGRGDAGPALRRRPRHRHRGRRSRVASRCRTRCGSTAPTASRGRSTRSSTTSRWRPASCAPSSRRQTPTCAAARRRSPPPAAADGLALEHDLAAPRDCRSRRHGVPRRDRRRVGHRRAATLADDTGLQLLENSIATGAGARRADPRVRIRVGRALQPGRHDGRPPARRHDDARRGRVRRRPDRRARASARWSPT